MPIFRFASKIPLEPIRVQRVKDERRTEEVFNDFSHHANPIRQMRDVAVVESFVTAPYLSTAQSQAFEGAMNRALCKFQADFESILQSLHDCEYEWPCRPCEATEYWDGQRWSPVGTSYPAPGKREQTSYNHRKRKVK